MHDYLDTLSHKDNEKYKELRKLLSGFLLWDEWFRSGVSVFTANEIAFVEFYLKDENTVQTEDSMPVFHEAIYIQVIEKLLSVSTRKDHAQWLMNRLINELDREKRNEETTIAS